MQPFVFKVFFEEQYLTLIFDLAAVCGGVIMATDSPQYITSPGYENGHYDNFQACTWHAKVRTSKKT